MHWVWTDLLIAPSSTRQMLSPINPARAYASCCCILIVLACTQPRESPPAKQAVDHLVLGGTDWIVVSLNGQPPIGGSNITMSFEGGSVSGYGGCNWYGSSYSARDTTVQFGTAESTSRACGTPAGVGQQEEKYHETLRRVAAIRKVDNRIALADRAGETVLMLKPRSRAAMNPADLVGTTWVLRSVNDTVEKNSRITLALRTEEEISGFAGCRGYTGAYSAHKDNIRVTSISMTATECNQGELALLREGQFTTDLSEASHYSQTDSSLEIITAPGRRLIFSAASPLLSQITGDWEKQEETLPPIQLRLWIERDTLRARLRLSGSESAGTATLHGRELRLRLSGRPEQLTGEFVSPKELELRFARGTQTYRLRLIQDGRR